MEKQLNQKYIIALSFITVVLWASAFAFVEIALEHFSPESLGFLRYLFSSIFLIIFAFLKKIKLPLIKDLPLFIISGFVGFSFYAYSFNIGSKTTSSSLSSIIISTAPIITALFAAIFLKERLNTFSGVALSLEFIGILIIFSVDKIFQIEIGVLWISLSSISLAIFNIIQRPLLKKYTPTQVTIYSIIFASIMLSIFAKKSINEIKTANFYQILNVVCLGVIP